MIDEKKLIEIIKRHKKWILGEEGGECANLSRADLSEVDLSDADLRWADLSRADLSGADLSGAYCRKQVEE